MMPSRRTLLVAPLASWLVLRRHLILHEESWTSVTLPEQALWTGFQGYQRHPNLPVLTFATERVGLGDPATLADIARRYVPRQSDVHIVTYPKAGTSWIQEVAWLVNHEADISQSDKVPSSQRTVYIELRTSRADKLSQLAAAASPRHIKWHHSSPLLPEAVVKEGKVIYLLRNPKDTAVSWYHFQRMNPLYGFTGSFDAFFELFLRGDVAYGSYMHNVLSWWRLRHRPNVLLLTYEEMHADRRMASNPSTNAAQMSKVAGETDFMRKGQVGDWRNYFSEEQSRRMDAWISEHVGDEQLPLIYDL